MTNAPGQRVPTWLRVGLAIVCASVLIVVMVRGARAGVPAGAPRTAARTRRGHPAGHDHTSTAAVDAITPTGPFSPARLSGHLDGSGRSRAEVATRIGRTEAELTSYEDGTAQPPPRVLAALAAMLGVPSTTSTRNATTGPPTTSTRSRATADPRPMRNSTRSSRRCAAST